MVAKVISGKNIRGVLNYNENKVKEGVAKCILANKFGCEPKELAFSDKLNRFQKLTVLNPKTKTNTIHISLNFHASENLSSERLSEIALVYMDKVGFGDQPYLVYQHSDAAHPHIHIVSTNIQRNGKRIDIHNIGKNQSEKARKEIEKLYGLVRAESKKPDHELVQAINIEKAVYGKSETKRSISNAVRIAVRSYKFTSLPELNAVLQQFNVMADRGSEGTLMYNKKGLIYSLLDERGNKIGIPIKASSIYGKPTLSQLEKQFRLNEALRLPHKHRLKKCIDDSFRGKPSVTRSAFIQALQAEGICVLFRQNEEGRVYGITFVDNKTKVVFNGSDLGKPYSAKAILERLSNVTEPGTHKIHQEQALESEGNHPEMDFGIAQVIRDLTTAQPHDFTSPDAAMKKRKRKKKRKGLSR